MPPTALRPPTPAPVAAAPAAGTEVRYHGLDALRATALLLGVALHAALSYLPGDQAGWAVQDRSTSLSFAAAALVVHAFRLPVFFLLAGFFARLVVRRRGVGAFLRDRLGRILVPLVLGWLLLEPLVAFAWIWGRMMHGDPALIGAALALGYGEMLNQLDRLRHLARFGGEFALTHLWFLYLLLQIYALFLLTRVMLTHMIDRGGRLAAYGDRLGRRLAASRWLLPVLAVATTPVLLGMRRWGIDTPDRSLLPHPPVLVLYGGIFTLGWWLHRNADALMALGARHARHLVAGGLLAVPVILLAGNESAGATLPHLHLVRTGYFVLYAAMLWALALGLTGLFLRTAARESRLWRYLADASYWVYLVHLPIVCTLQVWLSRHDFSCWGKFGATLALGTAACVLSYHFVVRSTPIGVVLNGRRHPFRWWP